MSQTVEIDSVSEGFYQRLYYGTTYTNWVTFNYDRLVKYSNDVDRRVKPDPLTPTATALQSTMRRRPSVIFPYKSYWPPNQQRMWKGLPPDPNAYQADGNTGWQDKVLDQVQKSVVNLGSSLAEYAETGRSFARFAGGLRDAYNLTRGRASRHSNVTLCSIAAADTVYAFGVKPLAEDLFSAYEALKMRVDEGVAFHFKKSSFSKLKTVLPATSQWHEGEVRSLVSDYVNLRVELKPTIGEITYGNPALWAWEVTPWSWLFDYGIGMGDWLMRLDAMRHVQSVSGTRTRRINNVSYRKIKGASVVGDIYEGSQGKVSYKSHQRFLVTGIPLPSPPGWDPSATWQRVRRLTAVLVTIANGRRSKAIEADPTKFYRVSPCSTPRRRVRRKRKRYIKPPRQWPERNPR